MKYSRQMMCSVLLLGVTLPAAANKPEKEKGTSNVVPREVALKAVAAKPAPPAAKPAVTPAPKPVTGLGTDIPKADLFLGYMYTRFNSGSPLDGVNVNGGGANVGFNFQNGWGLVVDFAGGRGSREIAPNVDVGGSFFTYLFGPRYSWRKRERVVPFLQSLFGGARGSDTVFSANPSGENSFAWTAGGGVDWIATPRVGWRIIQAEYMLTRFTGASLDRESQNNIRLMTGVVFRLGGASPPPPAPNRNPSVNCSAAKSMVYTGSNETVAITASGSDPDGDSLSYSWTASGGNVDGTGANARWNSTGTTPGSYKVTARVSDGKGGTGSCDTDIRVENKPNAPPTMRCSMERGSVLSGERVRVNVSANDPDGDRLNYNWRASGGQVVGSGSNVQLDTSGLAAGRYTVTGRVDDGRGGAADCSTSVEVTIPPPPPQASKINECSFRSGSARVDNVCKRILDDVATRLNAEPNATVVLVGYADPKEGGKLNGQRASAAAKYLGEKGVATSRINQRTATGAAGGGKDNRKVDVVWVPAGATY